MAEEFDDSRVWDRGGLRLRGGGRVTPGGGRLSNVPLANGAIEASINGILTASDPMQELIDAMVFDTKPDYMWGGNEASGAVEIGGSGFDLTDYQVLKEQSSAVLGDGNFTVFDANTERLSNTADSELRVGTGSFAALWVGNITSTAAGNHLMGDSDGTTGWRVLQTSGTALNLYLQSTSGLKTAVVSATVPTGEGEVIICVKDQASLDAHLFTSVGDATNSSIYDETLDAATPRLAVGDVNTGHAARMEFGIFALWKGVTAESITTTHRSNLATFLGF